MTESDVEQAVLDWLVELGYSVAYGKEIEPEGDKQERETFGDVILHDRLYQSLVSLNPEIPDSAIEDAIRKLDRLDNPNFYLNNHRFHQNLIEGVPVEFQGEDGRTIPENVKLVDFEAPGNNDWFAVNQFTVIEAGHNRRADVVVFVNGLPIAVIELKNPADPNATCKTAFHQLQTYKQEIPSLFYFNEILVASDGTYAKGGSLTADWDRFMPWRTIDGKDLASKGSLELEVLIKGMFEPSRLVDYLRHFIVFNIDKAEVVKKLAGYHQFHAVNKAVACTIKATSPEGDKRVGVIWHTQGSGKSLSMVFYAGKIIQQPEMQNPTLILLTDRNDLDDQLHKEFARSKDMPWHEPVHIDTREQLQKLLKNKASGGVIFTTIQKFLPEIKGEKYPLLSDRRNIIVICDEAHRSQYDFIDGFARHMRDALPNASFIGFSGTPIEKSDRNTRAVFGDYIDVYDIQRAVDDKITVPIYYEARLAKLELKESEKPSLDEDFEEITELEEETSKRKLRSKWTRMEALVGSEKRVAQVAKDLVEHFEHRLDVMDGKGLIVCMSRRICVDMFNAIAKLRPNWVNPDDKKGMLKVVMTGSASDPLDWQMHIRNKTKREAIATRFRDASDPLKLVIVRDMWLTGFDVPSLHTMYLDKPMRGHGLMQAIARVNRVFHDKPGGLVVDYLGLAEELKKALMAYSESDRGQVGIDQEVAVEALLTKYEILCAMFHGFDYGKYFSAKSADRLAVIPSAMEHILGQTDGKKRFMQAVAELTVAFALAVPHEEALAIQDEVGFFQAVRAGFIKATPPGDGPSEEETDAAIRQLISQAVAPAGVMDIFRAAGLQKPDISILSEEFLEEIRGLPQKNLAVEALARLLKDQIKVRFKTNVVKERSFSEMLENAIKRYQSRTIEAAQVIEELIGIAKEIKEAEKRGEALGLSDDEIAFYDALVQNESAKQVMGDAKLRVIAQLLVEKLRGSIKVDWAVRDSVRAQLRLDIKKILKKHGYPPDLQEAATKLVLEQAERLTEQWVTAV